MIDLKRTRIAARPVGGLDNLKTVNDWIVYDVENPKFWLITGCNKQFAKEFVKRWNGFGKLLNWI